MLQAITQSFRLISKIHLAILSLCFISGVSYADPIGDIVETTGIGQIVRNQNAISSSNNLPIELYDTAETSNGRILIEFLDKAELALTEHTQVFIDEVYYDPDPSKSKMAMRGQQHRHNDFALHDACCKKDQRTQPIASIPW